MRSLIAGTFLLLGVASARADDAKPWPPAGPTWETDPVKAFDRAREEEKPVFVYIATEACPHCVVMQKQVWPEKDVIEACKKVVCLAVYRWAREDDVVTTPSEGGKPKADKNDVRDSEWATRLDVMGYPQVRLLDAWARPLDSSDRYASPRTKEHVIEAVDAAIRDEKDARKAPPAHTPPRALVDRLSGGLREEVARPEPWRRARAWVRALGTGTWKAADLARLWEAEEDAIVRKAVLDRLPSGEKDPAAVKMLTEGLDGSNDYVRRAAIEAAARVGGDTGAKSLLATLEKAVGGRAGWKNPNNVLCAVTDAVQQLPDERFVEALGKVIDANDANNTATLNAVESLIAIGKEHGMAAVKPALERAKDRPGAHQKRIRALVEDALPK